MICWLTNDILYTTIYSRYCRFPDLSRSSTWLRAERDICSREGSWPASRSWNGWSLCWTSFGPRSIRRCTKSWRKRWSPRSKPLGSPQLAVGWWADVINRSRFFRMPRTNCRLLWRVWPSKSSRWAKRPPVWGRSPFGMHHVWKRINIIGA